MANGARAIGMPGKPVEHTWTTPARGDGSSRTGNHGRPTPSQPPSHANSRGAPAPDCRGGLAANHPLAREGRPVYPSPPALGRSEVGLPRPVNVASVRLLT